MHNFTMLKLPAPICFSQPLILFSPNTQNSLLSLFKNCHSNFFSTAMLYSDIQKHARTHKRFILFFIPVRVIFLSYLVFTLVTPNRCIHFNFTALCTNINHKNTRVCKKWARMPLHTMETTRGTHTILKRIRQSEQKITFQCFFVFLPCDRCLGTWTERQSFQCHGKLVSIMRTMALECNDCREQASNVDYIKAIFMWRTQWKKGSIFWASFGYVSIYFVNLIRAFTDFFHRKHLYGRMDLCNWYGTLDKHNNLMLAKLYNWNMFLKVRKNSYSFRWAPSALGNSWTLFSLWSIFLWT